MTALKTFNNRYRVDGTVGNGGMAIVYSGTDTLLRRRVAIKVLRDQYASDDDFVQRFSYEAQSAAKLSHPNIVSVYDFGREESAYYIVMELIDGSTLGDLLRDGRPLPEPVAIDYAVQIASGLAYAHRQGLLHRDVKPANILVTHDDVVKLSDFGIARAVSEHTLGVTQPGMVMGSVAYISPEQAQGKELDERSDLYSVGVVLYQMLTGRIPFNGETPVAVALKHVSEEPPAIPASSGVSPALASIVARLLRKTPGERFASATELASALREARERPYETHGADIAEARTTRFGAVSAQPPPRRSVAPDAGAAPEIVEVLARRGINPRWFIIPLLFIAALALGYFTLRGNPFEAKTIVLPNLAGQSATRAQQQLAALGLRTTVTNEPSENVAQDRVLRQDPAAGTKLAKNDPVALVVSGGLPRVSVPDVKGYNVDDARRDLQNAKLGAKVVKVYSASIPEGRVIDLSPATGTSIPQRSTVALTVSQGPKPIAIPNLVGKSVDQARAALRALGLSLAAGQQTESDAVPANTIMSQDPQSGANAKLNDTVNVVVSKGAPAIAVPNVVGLDGDAAQQKLKGAGLGANLQYAVDPTNASGKVTAQEPPAGASTHKGDKVKIIVSFAGSVPDLAGSTPEDARRALIANGYQVGNTTCVQDPNAKDGVVVRTEPEANSATKPGETVNLIVNTTACP